MRTLVERFTRVAWCALMAALVVDVVIGLVATDPGVYRGALFGVIVFGVAATLIGGPAPKRE